MTLLYSTQQFPVLTTEHAVRDGQARTGGVSALRPWTQEICHILAYSNFTDPMMERGSGVSCDAFRALNVSSMRFGALWDLIMTF